VEELNRHMNYDRDMPSNLESWLGGFQLDSFLHAHIVNVISSLPDEVRDDLVNDSGFSISDYEPGPAVVRHIPMGVPRSGRAARAVELKRTLRNRPEAFVRYVIAHEIAHAHLRNAGRFPGEDPEHAADALAALWGFPRP
jgi:hypothetical protein